jgi:hypothetical protein
MSSSEPKKIILLDGTNSPDTKESEGPQDTQAHPAETNNFPFKVKYVAPVEIKLVDFVSKEGNVQGPRKLVAFLPTGEAMVIVPDARALTQLSQDEVKSMHDWENMLHEKAKLLGGNIIIDPATGEVKAAPMPPGMSNMLGGMVRGPGKRG